MKKQLLNQLFCIVLLACSLPAVSQKKPVNYVLGTYPATPATSYSTSGFGPNSGSNYYTNRNYTLQYGKVDNSTVGYNRVVKLFTVSGESYSVTKAVPGAKPFRQVVVNRSNPGSVKATALFSVASQPSNVNGTTLYLIPDFANTMEDLINSYVINRGTDNVFVNVGTTSNNIERIDMLLDQPINVSGVNMNTSGFLVMERGGNDALKMSAITSASGNTVSGLATPISISSTGWGGSGAVFQSVVMQQVIGTDANLKPSQPIPNQEIAGVFVPLASMNISPGATIYGISIFASDVNLSNTDLLDISKYPTNTPDGAPGNYGVDFMAGGGFFTKALLVKGSVWDDSNTNGMIDNGEKGIANDLWANLVDPSGKVVSSIQVDANGNYTLFVADNNVSSGHYSVILTNAEKFEGTALTDADTPANGYGYTGVNVNGVANTENRSGKVDIGSITGSDITDINFGINAIPLSASFSNLTANLRNNQLTVQWNTLSETNNAYFDVELSADGVSFSKAGTVASKAINGNATTAISYSFSLTGNGTVDFLVIPALAFALGLLLLNRKNKLFSLLVVMSGAFLFVSIASCAKRDINSIEQHKKIFVRIKQVDKDGKYEYSKTIQAITE